jgi:hypothetical protein
MPSGEINVEGDGWIRATGIQTDLRNDAEGDYVEVTAFLEGKGQDGLLGKLFDRMFSRKVVSSLKLKIQKSSTKVLNFDFGGCKPGGGSWHKGHSAHVTFKCYKAGGNVSRRDDRHPNLSAGNTLGPIALGLLQEARRGRG